MDVATTAAAVAGLSVAVAAAIHAGVYLRASRRARDASRAAPCEVAGPARGADAVRLVVAETVASAWLVLAAARPTRLPLGDAGRARLAVLLVAPHWLPRRALAVLGRRLAARGALVDLARMPSGARAATLARVVARADRLRRGRPDRDLALVCYGCAPASAGALAELAPRRRPPRLVLLGAPPGPSGLRLPRAVTIRAAGDPWHLPATGGPGAAGSIELAGVGHLSLLVAPHVADVVFDACVDGDVPAGGA